MRVDLFDYDLPPERIALEPVSPRDAARLLYIRRDGLEDRVVSDLPDLLRRGDLLVLNDTKVIPAQLFGRRPARAAGGEDVAVDATLHRRLDENRWRALVRPGKRLRAGDVIAFKGGLTATVESRSGAEAVLDFETRGKTFQKALAEAGVAPLPPYIARRRATTDQDREDYQTVYAAEPGSVAAPTAGLHFTEGLLARLKEKGVGAVCVTLHVGAGTFLPVTADDTADHRMHSEWGEITTAQAATINQARAQGGRIIATGTTSLRLMEAAADKGGVVKPFCGETDLFITPGYAFRAADLLLTNFHLPRSTLFMLVCAFSGVEAMKAAYAHAIDRNYRFYSYGDACLLERAP